jgi:hypothetical protein
MPLPAGSPRRDPVVIRLFREVALALLLAIAVPATVSAQADATLPSLAELEAAGAVIGRIRVLTADVFDTDDPREDNTLFRWANAIHVKTRPEVVERALTFRSGDRLTVRALEETERVLRGMRILYDVVIRPVAYRDGVVDLEVATRDTWTLAPGIGASRSGGVNSGSVSISESNLLGTGTVVSLGGFFNVDRSGTEVSVGNERAFGGRLAAGFSHARNSDGERQTLTLARPFYTLDSRWAGGLGVSRSDRIDAVYNAGEVISEYRRREDRAEVFYGWSRGLIDGWVWRDTVGVTIREDAWSPEPGRTPPPSLPAAETLVAPFLRVSLVEDRFEKSRNVDQVARPEFLPMGFASTLQLGYAARAWGSSRDAWLYSANVSRGFEPAPAQTVLASAAVSGQYTDGRVYRQTAGGRVQYFVPHHRRWGFYASLGGDVLTNPGPLDALLLGGDNGLRGYPLRYQSGTRRVVLTLEERLYTDLFWFRLFRVGGAAFVDVGRAWGGDNTNAVHPGWLGDVGFGLRVFSVRASFPSVLHVDLAFPLVTDGNIRSVQFLVRNRTSF